MSADEAHRRRRTVKRRKTDSSRSHTERRKHEPSVSQQATTLELPATVEDLREARLKHLATPHDERRRSMKYEYTKTVKVKEAVNDETVKAGPSASKNKSSSRRESRSSRSKPVKEPASRESVSDSQYVYRSGRTVPPVPGAFESQEDGLESRVRKSRTKSESTKVSRPKTERRETEPAISRQSKFREDKPSRTSEHRIRRSTTNVPDRPQPIPRRSSTPVLPGSIVERHDPEATRSTVSTNAARKSGSLFGSLFAAKPPPVQRKVPCLTCGDEVLVSKTAKLPCTHRMCHACLRRIFKLATTDPAHMPPRCCTDEAISLKHVESLFDKNFKDTYNKKLKEYRTKNKIYCPARGCGEWVEPKHIKMEKGRKIGKCPSCKTLVCGICSQKMHKARDCPKDPATKEFAETAKKAGWQKCYNCNAMVELKEGCNHMTCRCTAEFCMVCGLRWKSCDCPWFNYQQADVPGDPVRYQQEMDRRREQELRDEAIARDMQALQMDNERPALFEWWGLANAAGRRTNQNGASARRQHTPPAMPGGWDDGPHQFQQFHNPARRYQREDIDPAGQDLEQEQVEMADVHRVDVPIVRHRVNRRREAAGPFEGRALTAEEREQERRIRAWATGGPHD